jgi:glycine C-acetyltransferase
MIHHATTVRKRPEPASNNKSHPGLNKSAAHFARLSGADLVSRTEPFLRWADARRATDVWPYTRSLETAIHPLSEVQTELGDRVLGLNFASQDYLGLSSHPAIAEAAIRAIRDFGPHSAGSPMLMGNTTLSRLLEERTGELLGMDHVLLFPTGWAAGFATITSLIRPDDHIILDNLAHACLQQGAAAATQNVVRHEHLDVHSAASHLRAIRNRDTKNGILVVTEGLYSMDSDTPDLNTLQQVCREYGATLLVDVAHDLGATGPGGGGQIAAQRLAGQCDLVFGAYSKSFSTNGGFLASNSRAVRQYVKTYGGPHIFSTAISPIQTAIALESLRIVQSEEGEHLRQGVSRAARFLRAEFSLSGIECTGIPSPIVMVPIGNEKVARVASGLLFHKCVITNLVEFPAVAVGSARYRMQVMPTHTDDHLRLAAREVVASIQEAKSLFEGESHAYAVVTERNGAPV